MNRNTIALHLAVASAGLVLAACGGEERPRTAAAEPAATATAARYCTLVRELDAAGAAFFSKLEKDENAGPKDYERAEREFVERFTPQLDELEAAAPPAIEEDVATLLAAQRERAGLGETGGASAGATAAESRIKAFEERECA